MIVALGGAIVYTRKITERNADIAGRRLAKAGKVGKKRLKQAKAYMTGNDPKSADKFYEELLRAMWGYIGDKIQTVLVAADPPEHFLQIFRLTMYRKKQSGWLYVCLMTVKWLAIHLRRHQRKPTMMFWKWQNKQSIVSKKTK